MFALDFYLTVNTITGDKTQTILAVNTQIKDKTKHFPFIAEHSNFMKYSLDKLN